MDCGDDYYAKTHEEGNKIDHRQWSGQLLCKPSADSSALSFACLRADHRYLDLFVGCALP